MQTPKRVRENKESGGRATLTYCEVEGMNASARSSDSKCFTPGRRTETKNRASVEKMRRRSKRATSNSRE